MRGSDMSPARLSHAGPYCIHAVDSNIIAAKAQAVFIGLGAMGMGMSLHLLTTCLLPVCSEVLFRRYCPLLSGH
ncbi:hypothetical protein BDW72DRAFT_171945 [Aspergillus terricola var. indicus]